MDNLILSADNESRYYSKIVAMKIIWGLMSFLLVVYSIYLTRRASKNKEKVPKINDEKAIDKKEKKEEIEDTPLDMMNDNTVEGLIN